MNARIFHSQLENAHVKSDHPSNIDSGLESKYMPNMRAECYPVQDLIRTRQIPVYRFRSIRKSGLINYKICIAMYSYSVRFLDCLSSTRGLSSFFRGHWWHTMFGRGDNQKFLWGYNFKLEVSYANPHNS